MRTRTKFKSYGGKSTELLFARQCLHRAEAGRIVQTHPARRLEAGGYPYSVTMGLIMAILFSAAAAYLGLKVGQVFEAAIPIAIIAVGVGKTSSGKKNTLRTEHHYPVHRRKLRGYRRRSYFTLPAPIFWGWRRSSAQIFPFVAFRRPARYPAHYTVQEIFRQGHARKAAFPGSHRDYRGACVGREEGAIRPRCWLSGLVGGLYGLHREQRRALGRRPSRRGYSPGAK